MTQEFQIRGELITLDALIKAVGLADSGALAKMMIAVGKVRVDGVVETRKTRKLRGGERIEVAGQVFLMKGDEKSAKTDA